MNNMNKMTTSKAVMIFGIGLALSVSTASILYSVIPQLHPISPIDKNEAQVQSVGTIGITVSSLDKVLPFYEKVLKFKLVWISEVYGSPWEKLYGVFGARIRTARLQLGKESIELNEYLTPSGRPIPVDSKSNDLWFQHIAIVVSNMETAYSHLRKNKVRHISTAPQRIPNWNKNAAGIKAFYFKDPDGHVLELISFPEGKGEPRWQRKKALFLGIDHTAIAIRSNMRGFHFYQKLLAMTLLGSGTNYGIEQARLNNVENAKVEITTFKAPTMEGPGIEFLRYIEPGHGRSYPSDSRANDLWHWQTTIRVQNLPYFWERIKSKVIFRRSELISKAIVQLPKTKRKYRKAFLARDLDKHAILFVEVE